MPQLSNEVIAGGTVITVVAAFSLVILLLMLLHIVLALALPAYAQRMSSRQERDFLLTPLGFYIICLFVGNLISAIGGVVQSQWVQTKAITQGPVCSAQAFLLQLGSNATALWIGLISISALRTFMFRIPSLSRMVALLLIGALWIAMILFDTLASLVISDHSGNSLYGIASLWCWITPDHSTARLSMQYVWMWVWSLVSAMCFFLVLLSIRGNISVKKDELGRSVKWSKRAFGSYVLERGDEQYGTLVGTVGNTMCWFPVCYITLTLPISVSRILETFGFPTPVYAFVFSAVCFLLLGIGFPILYIAIRHSWKYASTDISPSSTLCGITGDTPDDKNLHSPKDKHVSLVDRRSPDARTSISPTREYGFPSRDQDINERLPSMMLNGEELGMSTYRGNIAPFKDVSVSSQLHPESRSLYRPSTSTSTITSSDTIVPASTVLGGDSDTLISSQRQRSDSDVSVYTGPRAISPDINALFLASQTPASPTGPPPPPRKIKRTPIASVPIDVDESDQGSISSTLSPIDIAAVQNIPLDAQKSPDSMRTFWAAYEGGSPMTPRMPLLADAALNLDARKPHENPPATTATVATPLDMADIASPDSFHFQDVDPSVSVKPSISAVGVVGNKTVSKVIPVVRRNPRRSISFAIPAPPPAMLSEPGVRSSQSSMARFNGPSAGKMVLSEASTNRSYRTPHFQPGYV